MLRWAKGLFASSVVSGVTGLADLVPGATLMAKVLVCLSASLFLLFLAGSDAVFARKPVRRLYR